jgi:hypothetical protein
LFFFFPPKLGDRRQNVERLGWTTRDDRSWYSTLEFPHVTALQVEAVKAKKHITQLEQLPSGNWIVKYRRMTKREKQERK